MTTTDATPRSNGLITTQDQFKRSLENWRGNDFHVLTPAAAFTALPPQWGLLPVKVEIDTNEEAGEVYADKLFCSGDEVAISKNGLTKIAQGAGMSIKTERTDPRTIANYWEVRATVAIVGLDGTRQEWSATEELDLRDGTERSKKVLGRNNAAGALSAARAKGLRGCEARAINAAIRLYGIKQKYTREELRRPFIVLRMVFQPDMSNPTQAAIATQQAMGGVSALYPSTPLASLPPAQPEVLDVIDGTTGPRPTAQASRSQSAEPAPKPVTVVKVDHDMDSGDYAITLEGGVIVFAESAEVGKAAHEAKKSGAGVLVETEDRDGRAVVTQLQVQKGAAGPSEASQPASMPDGTTTIAEVKREKGTNKTTGKPWVRYDVTFATGEVASTFSQVLHQLIDEANQQKARVRITTSEREGYNDNLDKLEIVDKRQQSLPDPRDL
jgi:hypothetical protein